MGTKVLRLSPETENYWDCVRETAETLRSGGLVGLPTETVYGIAASAASREGIQRLRRLKDRETGKPFTLHIAKPDEVCRYAGRISPLARRLIRRAWPGPLTLILPIPANPPEGLEGSLPPEGLSAIYHDGTIGVRCPDCTAALDVLAQAEVPVVASSANRFGEPPQTDGQEVLKLFEGQIDLLVNAGRTRYTKASTIIRLTSDNRYELVREGVYDERTIRRLSSLHILFVCSGNTCRSPMATAIFRRLIADKLRCAPDELPARGVVVESAGTYAFTGAPASPEVKTLLGQRRMELGPHSAQSLTAEMIDRADYIFTMTTAHLDHVVEMRQDAAEKTRRVARETDIEDPIGASLEVYSRCADQLTAALERRLEEIEL